MISKDKLMQILIKGRLECYVSKSTEYNPYVKSDIYDWKFTFPVEGCIYTDAFRGFNPYSGVEYVYVDDKDLPVWSCDYVGHVVPDTGITADKVYTFLKEARGAHLMNCNGNLFSSYHYENGVLQYKTYSYGDMSSILQMENFYYNDKLVAQQMSAGRLKV